MQDFAIYSLVIKNNTLTPTDGESQVSTILSTSIEYSIAKHTDKATTSEAHC